MTISPGTRFGPYEIVAPIGAGGMGEVYRARDTRLDRAVAVKILPAEFAGNAQLKLRFEREARAISQLSHPNICTLFDVGDDYLVMELLDGESLADRTARGPLPLMDVLKYGTQIAEALGKAHREGVIHRDLKPGNVMITKAGAKLLDFGLAKTVVSAGADGVTMQKSLTQEGTIVGTFQYMAPEQLGGEEPDARTDIFALGAVLYEMITGKRAFEGKTKTSLIAAIVSAEPAPMAQIQPLTPPALDHVVKKCLAKDPDDRWQNATDVAAELRWISEVGSQAGVAAPLTMRRQTRERLAWSLAGLLLIAAIAAGTLYWRAASRKPQLMRFSILVPPNADTYRFDAGGVALSPDGKQIVMSLRTPGVARRLWLRRVDAADAVPMPETNGASYPFWSPDGKFIAFFSGGKLKKIAAEGGPPQVICDAPAGRGGSWSESGTIVFVPDIYSPLMKVSSGGGTPVAVTAFDKNRDATQRWPAFLPDGRHFVYVRRLKTESDEKSVLVAASIDSPDEKTIIENVSNAAYVSPGWLVFSRGEALMAIRFDPRSLRTSGEATALPVGKVGFYPDRNFAFFGASANGTLVYLPPNRPTTQMRWVDNAGRVFGAEEEPGFLVAARLSPDGKRLAFSRTDDGNPDHADIWLHDVGTSTTSRFTFDGGYGVIRWSADGKRLYFARRRPGTCDLFSRAVAGSATQQPVYISPRYKETLDISPDGKYVLASEQVPETGVDLMLVSMSDGRVTPFVRTPGNDWMAAFSPDGAWIAFQSQSEIYVRRFPDTGEQWQVSTTGGFDPQWRRDGGAIFYTAFNGAVKEVAVHRGESFTFDPPRSLFTTDVSAMPEGLSSPLVAISNDAQRFLVITKTDAREIPFQVVLNWPEMLQGKS